MRFRSASLAALTSLAVALITSACVPDQRPDVSFSIRTCDQATSGGTIKHNTCLIFDGSDSHSFVGAAHYEWSADLQSSVDASGRPVFTIPLPLFATSAGNAAITPGRSWFANVLDPNISVRVTLRVSDSHGGHRTASRELLLTNTRPSISNTHAQFLRPRALDLLFAPFLVAHLPVNEPENDDLNISVTQLSPPPGPLATLQALRCRDIPAHFAQTVLGGGVLPDPSEGDPNAWCFAMIPQDDLATPIDESAPCQDPGVDACLATPAAYADPLDFKFRVKVLEENEPDVPSQDPTSCSATTNTAGLATEVVTCITVRSEDVLWTAASSSLEAGQITRVAGGWHRAEPTKLVPRDGQGMTEEPSGRVWTGATKAACVLVAGCPSGLLGISPRLDLRELYPLGQLTDVIFAPNGPGAEAGLWATAVSLGPSTTPGNVSVPFGAMYEVFLPSSALTAPEIDLHALASSVFTFVTNFDHSSGGAPNFVEFSVASLPQADGSLWIETIEYCSDYNSGTSACDSQTPGAEAYFENVRAIPASMLVPGAVVDLQTIPSIFSTLPSFPLPAPLRGIAPDGNGGAFVTHAVNGRALVSDYDSTGTFVADVPYSGDAFGLAYDAVRDTLWISDLYVARIERVATPLAQTASVTEVDTYFTLPLAMSVDSNGELWVDEHPNDFTRRIVHVSEDGAQVDPLDAYASRGAGIATGGGRERGAWHPDLLDLVRQPVANPVEIPSTTDGPIAATLAGVDPTDGAAYVFSSFPGEKTLMRIATDGTESTLLSLDVGQPLCGAVAPDLPNFATGGTMTAGSLWLCVPDAADPGFSVVRISLARLRKAARLSITPPTVLTDCTPSSPPSSVCADDRVLLLTQLSTGTYPDAMVFSLAEFHLYVLGHDLTDASIHYLTTIVDPRAFSATPDPAYIDSVLQLTGANTPSTTAHQPLAPALIFDTAAHTPGQPEVDVGGVWLLTDDGASNYDVQRFNLSSNGIAATPGFRIPSVTPLETVATDVLGGSIWVSANTTVGNVPQGHIVQVFIGSNNGVPSISGCGAVDVPTEAQATAIQAFSRTAWISGTNETLVRVHAANACSLDIEYVRRPDLVGNNPATPGGLSLSAGGP